MGGSMKLGTIGGIALGLGLALHAVAFAKPG
jgi:hypothetical protein